MGERDSSVREARLEKSLNLRESRLYVVNNLVPRAANRIRPDGVFGMRRLMKANKERSHIDRTSIHISNILPGSVILVAVVVVRVDSVDKPVE